MSKTRVLVVGGGSVALRKIRTLLRSGAEVLVVAPNVRPELARLASSRKMIWRRRRFDASVVSSWKPTMLFACTDSEEVNAHAAETARSGGIWINRADSPAESSVHVPSVTNLGALSIAIFSGGLAPVFVKHVRRRLERVLGPRVAVELRMLAEFRRRLRGRVSSPARRKHILSKILEDGTLESASALPSARRRRLVEKWIEDRT